MLNNSIDASSKSNFEFVKAFASYFVSVFGAITTYKFIYVITSVLNQYSIEVRMFIKYTCLNISNFLSIGVCGLRLWWVVLLCVELSANSSECLQIWYQTVKTTFVLGYHHQWLSAFGKLLRLRAQIFEFSSLPQ